MESHALLKNSVVILNLIYNVVAVQGLELVSTGICLL